MITLKTLDQASEQEVFEQIANHLLKQNTKALTEGGDCVFRTNEDLKCAAGCLISDEDWQERPELNNYNDYGWYKLVEENLVPDTHHQHLITDLQEVHDQYEPEDWNLKLIGVGKKRGLDVKFLENGN